MPQLYMVRVAGREYGPIDREGLRDWAREGRLLPDNEVRVVENQNWFHAGALDRVFGEPEAAQEPEAPQDIVPPAPEPAPLTAGALLERTWVHYLQGIGTFFLVMLPVGLSGAVFSIGRDLMETPPDAAGAPWVAGMAASQAQTAGLILMGVSLLVHLLAWPVCEAAAT